MTHLPELLLVVCGLLLLWRPRALSGLGVLSTLAAAWLIWGAPLASEPAHGMARDGWAVWCQLVMLLGTASSLAFAAYTESGWRARTSGYLLLGCAAGCFLAASTHVVMAGLALTALTGCTLLALRSAAVARVSDLVWAGGALGWTLLGLGGLMTFGDVGRLDWIAPPASGGGAGAVAVVAGVGGGGACGLLFAARTVAREDVPAAFGAWLITPLVAGLALAARCAVGVGSEAATGFAVLAVALVVVGHVLAARAGSLKAAAGWLLAGQGGFLGLALAASAPSDLQGAAMQSLALTLIHLGLLGMVLVADNELGASAYERLGGLGRRNPWMAGWLGVLLAGLLGLPPTLGFAAKLSLLRGALGVGQVLTSGLALASLALLGWVVLRLLDAVLFTAAAEPEAGEPLVASSGLTLVCAAFPLTILWLGLGPAGLLGFTQRLQLLSG